MNWIIAFSALLLITCHSNQEKRIVKIGLSHSANHSFTQALLHFDSLLNLQTNGKFDVRIYHSSRLGSEKEMQEMMTLGSLEGALAGLLNNYDPIFAIFEMPYLYRDRDHVFKVFNGEMMKETMKPLEARGLVFTGFYENGFRNITNSIKSITHPEDLKGLLIRTPENPAYMATFEAMGAIPTPMSFSELYTALLQGVVDGQENPLQNIWFGRLYEAQKHIALTYHIYNPAYVLFSKRFWDSLTQEEQKIFRECVAESTRWQLDYMKKLDKKLEQTLKEKGMQFTYPDRTAFEKASLPAYDIIYQELGDRARKIVTQIKNMP
ncbi:MAG: TRAP transporter substrate-binding protein [Bacteroidota bacterium]